MVRLITGRSVPTNEGCFRAISIITPNYNYSKYIGQLIESVLNQSYSNFEHIIVDDGSTDASVKIKRLFKIYA